MRIPRGALRLWIAALAACAAVDAGAANYLWEVSSISNRVSLYGTMHAGKGSWYPLPDAVEKTYQDSAVLVVEADITDEKAMAKSSVAMTYTPPDSIRNHVPPEEYARFRKLLPRYSLPEDRVAQMKPFMAVSLLVFSEWARLGFLPQYGIDAYFIKKAKAELKPIVEIEGVDVQIRLVTSLTDKEAATIFKGTLDALEAGLASEQVAGMVNAWQNGDPQLVVDIARRYNERVPGAAEFEEKFVWARHADMLGKIEGYLRSGQRHFIAVGALHLAGERGLVELLRARGYLVRHL